MKKIISTILSKENVAFNTFVFKLQTSQNHELEAGKFFMAYTNKKFLGVALAVFEIFNPKEFSFILKINGVGTLALSNLNVGDNLPVLLPLSDKLTLTDKKIVYFIGGGVGIAPMYEIIKAIPNSQKYAILAFRKENEICGEDKFLSINKNVNICCDEKTNNYFHGNVIEYLNTLEINYSQAYFYICGSFGMLKALDLFLSKRNAQGKLLLENVMACGFGVCNSCNILLKNNSIQKVCENYAFDIGTINYE